MVAFADTKFNEQVSPAQWEKVFFSKGAYTGHSATGQPVFGSLNDYYQEISCGLLHVTGKVFGAVTVSKKRADYSSGNLTSNPPNRSPLFPEALDLLLARDGQEALRGFDGLLFVYAGPWSRGQTQRGNVFWPHKSNFGHRGKRWDYFVCPEGGERLESISVACHEFGHMLGLPDLYARPDSPGSEGIGVWCTMATGHGRDGKPLHFSAWCKEQLNWLVPCVIDPRVKQKLVLAPVEGSIKECYKVLVRPDGGEYLLLENRTRKGFDKELPGEGLLIWRVVDGKPVLEESHGVAGPEGPRSYLGSVPYPSRANTAFTPYTQPPSSPTKPGGAPVHITNIHKLPDGRITFHIGYEYL
jgi:M6 family metalloprotease-like protein